MRGSFPVLSDENTISYIFWNVSDVDPIERALYGCKLCRSNVSDVDPIERALYGCKLCRSNVSDVILYRGHCVAVSYVDLMSVT
jgi:hypothetical protein